MAAASNKGTSGKKRSSASKAAGRAVKKQVRKLSFGSIVLCLILLVTGVVIGETAYHMLTAADAFELVGEKTVTVKVGENFSYTDEGIQAVKFGVDYSDRVVVETNLKKVGNSYTMDTSQPGRYYMIYRVDEEGFENLQKVRIFEVVAG
ncbi:MAG: hypothetical protein ACI3XR_10685 [Eubacteriales bacterium]